jgi:transposase InsO family protein
MDFVVGLPLMARRHNSIFVVVDTLTNSVHFIHVRTTYQAPDIARVFISEIVRLHGVPKRIISDRGSVFTRRFWTSFQEALGTQLNLSTVYHPEIDGQTERMNQTLEDMIAHVRDGPTKALGRILSTSGVFLQQQLP